MAVPDKFARRYDKEQERKRLNQIVTNPDDPPLPDDPVEQAKADHAIGRNDPCPCGSGKKFKKCCGKDK